MIRSRYRGTMRAWDGSEFQVDWSFVTDDDAETLPFVHPFVSGREEPLGHEDLGYVGEIPVMYAPASNQETPDNQCPNCFIGLPEWWSAGWPSGSPPVVLGADGWPVDCKVPPMPVSSVGLSAPIEFIVTGSPVTSTGVLTFRWVSEPANTVLAAPDGAAGFPSFRRLTAGDIAGAFGLINTVAWLVDATGGTHGLPMIGSYTLQDGESVFNADTLTPVAIGPWIVHPGPWTRPSWYPSGQTITGYFIVNVRNGLIGVFGDFEPCLLQIAPYATGDVFTPWIVDTTPVTFERVGTGGFSVVGGLGIRCTPNVPQPTNQPGTIVVDLADTIAPTVIGSIPLSTAPSTNNSLFVDSTTFLLTWIDNVFNVAPILTGINGVQLFVFELDFTQVTGLPGSTAVVSLGSLPANAILIDAYGVTDSNWTPGAIITALKWARTLNNTPPVGGSSNFSINANPVGWDTSLGFSSDYSQPVFNSDQITFWAQVTSLSTLSAITGGHSHVYGFYFLRP